MDIFEISGFKTGIDKSGVNFLDPSDAFKMLNNGYIYRQEILSRKGFVQFANRLSDETRVMGIFENIIPNGTNELLVCSKDYLYKYNSGTNQFDQIAFNSAVPIGTFGITNPEDYVSGTTYLEADGSQRFVFTGKGMSDVYFYDGTDVKRFTNTTDNPNYAAPTSGALSKAHRVIWFGERLNFFIPTIGGQVQEQGVLYSGIRNAAGNGDKFNVPGSGLLSADTYEKMKAAFILGDIMIMNFERSNWSLEKTRDAFNPYFVRKIPSILGTDASWSGVQWAYEIKSMGKTGLITTDGRKTLQFDNMIPYFTEEEVDQGEFELTYGGFDRINGQFLFAYRDKKSLLSSITQDKVLVYNYEFSTWSQNDQRFSVFGQTDVGQNKVWSQIDGTVQPSWARWDTTEEIWNKIGLTAATQKTLAGDDLGFVYQINSNYNDYFVPISAITNANPCQITVDACALQAGDEIIFENVEGMTEINGMIGTIEAVISDTVFELDIDSTGFSAYTTNGTVSKIIDFNAQTTVFNPYRDQGRKCNLSHLEFLVNSDIGDLYVDIIEDEEETPFKTVLLRPNTATTKNRQWITVIVNDEANFFTFILRDKTATKQKIISAIRIHCSPGSLNAG